MARDLLRDMSRFGGLALRRQLLELGNSSHQIVKAIEHGALSVPRRGWIATKESRPDAMRAVELGGVLGAWSALESHGIWADGDGLVVSVNPQSSRLPQLAPGERRVWIQAVRPVLTGRKWRVSVIDALVQQAALVDRPSLIASIDSAMHTHLLSNHDLRVLGEALPERLRGVLRQADGRAMSGTESKLRVACIAAGMKVELQPAIDRVGYVDLLVDDWLIVEVDSRKFHDGPSALHRDKVRDGNAVLGDFGTLRFDYPLVQFEIDWCIQVILARLRSGRP